MNTLGVVLAGGKSSRMGQDKSRLCLDGQSMLTRSKRLLQACGLTNIIISASDISPNHIQDIYPCKGPLGGFHAVTHAFPDRDLLCIPVDMPLLCKDTLSNLLRLGRVNRAITYYHHHRLPIYLKNSPALREYLDNTLRSNADYSIRALCRHFPALEVPIDDDTPLFNSNTAAQWQQALSLHQENK